MTAQRGAVPSLDSDSTSVHARHAADLRRGAISVLIAALLVGAVTSLLFLLAIRWFAPGSGTFSAVVGGASAWTTRAAPNEFGQVPTIRGVAQQMRVDPGLLILTASLNSLFLIVLSLTLASAAGIATGFWLAVHAPTRIAAALRSSTSLFITLPGFFVAFLLQVAAVELTRSMGRTLVPVYGFGLDAHLVIPVLALSAAPFAYITQLTLVSAIELNLLDFARTARAKGLSEQTVVYRHIAPNMWGMIGEAILGGGRLVIGSLVIVEYLVVWPGLGILGLRAANAQDLGLLLACVAPLALLFYVTELGLDIVTRRTGVVSG